MQTTDLVRLYTQRLQNAGIPYMVTGSVACIVYGEPRLTHDVDLVVELTVDRIPALQIAFPPKEFYCPPEETLRIDVQRSTRGSFNIIHHETGFKADFYLVGRDPLQKWGLSQARMVDLGTDRISLAAPEYVILRKLEFFREGGSDKHLRDISGMLRKQPELKDAPDLMTRIDGLGLRPQWASVLKYRNE